MTPQERSAQLAKRLLHWYSINKRDLPWRKSPQPYSTWISEIMLQQTRVEAVIPYYHQWLKQWPTINELAQASEDEVVLAWKGLGYYSRARNILKCARILHDQYRGEFPLTLEELIQLPGIGRYTAGAILSIALHQRVSLVDGNVARVFSRLFLRKEVVNDAKEMKVYYEIADEIMPKKNFGDYNQALMELGAMICSPQNPDCSICPLVKSCDAYRKGEVSAYPRRKKMVTGVRRKRIAFLLVHSGRVYLRKQNSKGLFYGLYELPYVIQESGQKKQDKLERMAEKELPFEGALGNQFCQVSHTFTKYRETIYVYCFTLQRKPIQWGENWVKIKDLSQLPTGSAHQKIFQQIQEKML